MGFDGFVISDWTGIDQHRPATYARPRSQPASTPASTCSWSPYELPATSRPTLIDRGRTAGSVPMARIDDAVSPDPHQEVRARAVRAPVHRPHATSATIGSPAHRAVARAAVAEVAGAAEERARARCRCASRDDVYVAGSNADNIGNQAGGWTLTWQGGSTNVIPGDDDPRRASATPRAATSPTARTPRRRCRATPTGVVVVGETPYAEGFGDVGGPQWAYDPGDNGVPRPPKTMQLNDADKAAVDKVCAAARDVRGARRLGPAADHRPGAAARRSTRWSPPGCPAARATGVADVLFGAPAVHRQAAGDAGRGRVAQEPINVGDADYDPLYPFGWGLRSGSRSTLTPASGWR